MNQHYGKAHFTGILLAFLLFSSVSYDLFGQCIAMRDFRNGNRPSFAPRKNYRCLSAGQNPTTVHTITFVSAVSNIVVNWGDGTIQTIPGPTSSISYTYTTTGIFNYTITQPNCSTIIQGIFINDYNTSVPGLGFIAPPFNNARVCLPHVLNLRNSTPGMNGFTEFFINWGDGLRDTVDFRSFNQNIPHEYLEGKRLCNVRIIITYNNICGVIPGNQPPPVLNLGPYLFMEKDSALTQTPVITFCEPIAVNIRDASKLNCNDTVGRQISWTAERGLNGTLNFPGNNVFRTYNLGIHKELVIPASSFTPVPADSTYKVRLNIRNACGQDTAIAIIRYVRPNMPRFTVQNDNPCPGEPMTFLNTTSDPYGIQEYEWDFGDGNIEINNLSIVTHTYTFGGSYTVKLSASIKGHGGQVCSLNRTIQVSVRPSITPVLRLTPSKTGCDSLLVNIKNISVNASGAQWLGWQLSGIPLITAGGDFLPNLPSSNPGIVRIVSLNPNDSSFFANYRTYGAYVLRVRAQSPGCPEFFGRDTVRIFPSPTIRWAKNLNSLCLGELLRVRDSSRVTNTDQRGLPNSWNRLTWELDMGDNTVYRSTQPVANNFDNPVASNRVTNHPYQRPGIFWVKLRVRSGSNCWVTDSFQVNVRPNAVPGFSLTRVGCNNSEVQVNNFSQFEADKYELLVFRGGSLVSNYTRTRKDTFSIFLPYAPPGDSTLYQIRLRAKTGNGPDSCSTISAPVNIRIAPTPISSFVVQPTTDGCSPLLGLNFLNTSANLPIEGGIRFQWNFGQGRTFDGPNPPPQDFENNGLFNRRDTVGLSLVRGDGCVYTSTRFIIVYPTPRAQIDAPDSICSGETVRLEGNGVGVNAYIWQFPDFDASTTTLVSPSKTFTNITSEPRFYTIRLSVVSAANCTTTVEKIIKVNPNPSVNILATTVQQPNCGALSVNFRYGNPSNAVRYVWHFGSNDSLVSTDTTAFLRDFTNETAAAFNRNITLTSYSAQGCFATVSQQITVNPLVRARFTQSADSGCTPLPIMLLDSSTAAANVKTWIVNGQIFNNLGQVNTVLRNGGLQDTVFVVKLAVRNNTGFNCRDTMTRQIKVFAKPKTLSLTATPTLGCSPVAVNFQNDVLNAVRNFWDFKDGRFDTTSVGDAVAHVFENPNTIQTLNFRVLRIAESLKGCRDTAQVIVSVRPFTKANMTTLSDTAGCTPFPVQFSSGTSINANSFSWDFGDGSNTASNPNPLKTFVNNSDSVQRFIVRLIAQRNEVQNCPDTTKKTIVVYPLPVADFTLDRSEGCGPLPVSMANNSAGSTNGFWVITAGGLSDTIRRPASFDTVFVNPNFVPKTIKVEYLAFNQFGCFSKKEQNVVVFPNLTARFNASTQGCTPFRVSFTNRSENTGGTYYWNFGDGRASTDENPTHIFNYTGASDTTFRVLLSSISEPGTCVAEDSLDIKVFGRPANSFDILSPLVMVLPENMVRIRNNTTFRENWSYRWDFEDLQGKRDTSNAETFDFTYNLQYEDFTFLADTIFNITMVARNAFGCADTLVKTIIIKPGKPEANFFANIREGCAPLTVTFRDTSKFGRWYEWEFGDGDGNGGSSFERHPIYTYTTPGQKRVKLTVKGYGGTDVEVKEAYINVYPSPSARFISDPTPPREVIVPEEFVKFTALESNLSYQYMWNFGDGNTSNERSPSHNYQNPGAYTVSLTVTGENGCLATDTVKNAVLAIASEYIRAPNVFIPNPLYSSGGVIGRELTQDIFYPQTKGAEKIKIQIFNRWGQLFFQSNQLYRGWDGYVNGKLAPSGTYVYRIEVTYVTGKQQVITGDITLIR